MELIVISYRYGERNIFKEIGDLGEFHRTGFRDVIRSEVENFEVFLIEIEKRNIFSLSRVVPIEKSFQFSPSSVVEEFIESAKPLVERIMKGESFCVRIERRGLKGLFSSQQVAKEIGSFIFTFLEERDGVEPKVDLEDPDKAVIFETLGRWCGVGIMSKKMRKEHYYLKLP